MFRLCKDLGIDDPFAWMNSVPSNIVDAWMAFYMLESKKGNSDSNMVSPEAALKKLQAKHG